VCVLTHLAAAAAPLCAYVCVCVINELSFDTLQKYFHSQFSGRLLLIIFIVILVVVVVFNVVSLYLANDASHDNNKSQIYV